MREAQIEKDFVRAVEEAGFLCLKLRADGRDGFPDRTVITPRGCFFVEFKVPGGKLRGAQRVFIRKLRELDLPCEVATSAEKAFRALMDWYSEGEGQ